MKRNILIILAVVSAVLFESCATSSVSLQVLTPADITVPTSIKKLAVVNRSLPDKGEKLNNIVEGVLTGEGFQTDREASYRCVDGVSDVLVSSPRYTVKVPANLDLRGTGTAQWPTPLDWSVVAKICKDYDADALVSLEIFDSNTAVRMTSREKTKKVNDKDVKYTEHLATMDIAATAGWRIYDPVNKRIVDQNTFVDHKFWEGVGENPDQARAKLPQQRGCIVETGHFAGQQYGLRISPVWIWVSRSYYKKGNSDFEDARYKVHANDWKKAAELWQKNVNSPDPKIAGRASYNMALACEVEGELSMAYDWAKKAYVDFHNKAARSYMSILADRMADAEKLKNQME